MRKLLLIPIVALGLAACTTNDAQQGERDTGSARTVYNMPNHFNNVVLKCTAAGNGIYESNNSGDGGNGTSIAVVERDPECG